MTKVRVLNGLHGGASIDWIHPTMKVGAQDDDDIYIGDWNAQTVELVRNADGTHQAQWHADGQELQVQGSQAGDGFHYCILQQWVPVRFGGIILCIGPSDEPWPDDADLLQKLFAPPVIPVAKPSVPKSDATSLLILGLTMFAIASSATVGLSMRDAGALGDSTRTKPAEDATRQLRNALADKRWSNVELLEQADRLVVRGVLDSRELTAELHQRINAQRSEQAVDRRFMDAPSVLDLVRESVPEPGLEVRRTAPRDFEVSGHSAHVSSARQALQRLAADLAPMGITLRATVQPTVELAARVSGTLTEPQGTSYARTRDGVKHIVSSQNRRPSAAAAGSESSH